MGINERDNKMITYHIPLESDKGRSLLLMERRFLGKQVGHRMYLSEAWFELKEFGWEENYRE